MKLCFSLLRRGFNRSNFGTAFVQAGKIEEGLKSTDEMISTYVLLEGYGSLDVVSGEDLNPTPRISVSGWTKQKTDLSSPRDFG